ncbi:MAG: endo-1,4-beta-xylanase [Verrucomicrobiota bacterium JB024]|nr:endo-1,4-beta-xylanase [Verrucomicrobiota bacterium JB024]
MPEGERLRVLAEASDIWIGAAVGDYQFYLVDSDDFRTVVSREYSFFTSLNEMKMAITEPVQEQFSYSTGEDLVDLASTASADVHGHTLVWFTGGGMPSWVSSGSWTATTLTDVMYKHIDNVVGHWAGDIAVWDVVNEAFAYSSQMTEATDGDGQPWTNSLRGAKTSGVDIWYDVIGSSYVEKAFIRAAAADPNALLIYNDYSTEEDNYKSRAVRKMVADFQARGIPIDGVGTQMHMSVGHNQPDSTLRTNFDALSALGVNVFITEFDCPATVLVSDGSGGYAAVADSDPPTPFGLDRQARSYYNTLDMALRSSGFVGFQTWGVQNPPTGTATMPFSATGFVPEPAYYAMQDALGMQVREQLASNPGMEDGAISPWINVASTLTLSSMNPHSGSSSLAVTQRSVSYAGPRQNVTSALKAEGAGRYFMRGWMRTASGSATGKVTLCLQDGAGTHYIGISQPISSTWTEVSGWINAVWFKELTSATLYAETPGSSVDFYLDDVSLSDGNLARNGNFSDGLNAWAAYTGGSISPVTDDTNLNLVYKYGSAGCLASGRSASSQGPGQKVKDALLAAGPGTYQVQAWVKLQKPDAVTTLAGTGKLTIQLKYGGQAHYIGISKAISSDQWTRISGPLDLEWDGELTSALLYVETPGSTAPVYIDEIMLRK